MGTMTGLGTAALVTGGAVAATIAIDRALKVGVEHALDEGEQVSGPFGIRIRRQTNDHGIAGREAGSQHDGALLAAGGALALAIAGAGAWFGRGGGLAGRTLQVGAGLVAGGMAANLVDRASGGGVTDFLPSPLGVINGADAALGAGLLVGGAGILGLVLR
jgi:lipoprotein signal peptidase